MSNTQNYLIEFLPRKERRHLLAVCEPINLVFADVLCEPGERTRYVYFPVDGFISLLTQIDGKVALEVGMVGREGMLGVQLALGVMAAPVHAVVQGSGSGWRVRASTFKRELARSAPLHKALGRYTYVLMQQQAGSAACLRYHEIGPRLARWLLMTQDRAHANQFRVTHEFLAYMLGVRRVGVTRAAIELQRTRHIEYRRGKVTVLDRAGLESAACDCYAADRKSYAEVLELPARRRARQRLARVHSIETTL
ncbi:MAG: Crp/Fnr family transcriptional regulator [Salinisphaera sp.]|jgi:CRP-like cAMP-binding protein|nr:Crp/Fnr family transcriptional regulator [Salinisphaera sp.]